MKLIIIRSVMIAKWFKDTKWLTTATMIVSVVAIEFGSLSARYSM